MLRFLILISSIHDILLVSSCLIEGGIIAVYQLIHQKIDCIFHVQTDAHVQMELRVRFHENICRNKNI